MSYEITKCEFSTIPGFIVHNPGEFITAKHVLHVAWNWNIDVDLLKKLDQLTSKETIYFTNTSSIPISENKEGKI